MMYNIYGVKYLQGLLFFTFFLQTFCQEKENFDYLQG